MPCEASQMWLATVCAGLDCTSICADMVARTILMDRRAVKRQRLSMAARTPDAALPPRVAAEMKELVRAKAINGSSTSISHPLRT